MIKAIKQFINVYRNKETQNFGDKKLNKKNVYNAKNFGQRLTFVHRHLKQLFLNPVIMLLEWWYGPKLTKELPDEYHLKKVKIFDESFEDALKVWSTQYQPHAYGKYNDPKKYVESGSVKRLRLIKNMYKTVIANDTAYLEFHNILMLELRKNMDRESDKHLFYTSTYVDDPRYFIITGQFPPEQKMVADALVNGNLKVEQVKKYGKKT